MNRPPKSATPAQYPKGITPTVRAIREENREPIIVADGLSWAQKPVAELVPLGVAQSLHGYAPPQLTHYRASWMQGAEKFPLPAWPLPVAINGFLYGDVKPDLRAPLVITGRFPAGARVSVTVGKVSQ